MPDVTINVTLRMRCSELLWNGLVLENRGFYLYFKGLDPSLDPLKSLFGGGGES